MPSLDSFKKHLKAFLVLRAYNSADGVVNQGCKVELIYPQFAELGNVTMVTLFFRSALYVLLLALIQAIIIS